MPHKHKRKRGEEDKPHFDLPPTAKAKPLSVQKAQTRIEILDNKVEGDGKANKRRKTNTLDKGGKKKAADDTPKQFARLMAWSQEGRALRKGLDDGEMGRKERKRKKKDDAIANQVKEVDANGTSAVGEGAGSLDGIGTGTTKATTTKPSPKATAAKSSMQPQPSKKPQQQDSSATATDSSTRKLKIQPGERLSDFALRVDQTLPLSGVPKHSTKETLKIPGMKSKQNLTKHNKKLLRLQSQWREEEKRRKEKGEEREDEIEDQKEEDGLLWSSVHDHQSLKKGKKMKRGGVEEGDIWKVLERKREGQGKVLTASQMVQEPPKLGRLKNMFKEPGKARFAEEVR